MRKGPSLDPDEIRKWNARRLDSEHRDPDYGGPQMTLHRKPNPGSTKDPCEVCGCLGLKLGVRHHALAFGQYRPRGAVYLKFTAVPPNDSILTYLDASGAEVS